MYERPFSNAYKTGGSQHTVYQQAIARMQLAERDMDRPEI